MPRRAPQREYLSCVSFTLFSGVRDFAHCFLFHFVTRCSRLELRGKKMTLVLTLLSSSVYASRFVIIDARSVCLRSSSFLSTFFCFHLGSFAIYPTALFADLFGPFRVGSRKLSGSLLLLSTASDVRQHPGTRDCSFSATTGEIERPLLNCLRSFRNAMGYVEQQLPVLFLI